MPSDQDPESQQNLSPLPSFVTDLYPELVVLRDELTQQRVAAVYQHSRTIRRALDAFGQPTPTQRYPPSLLKPLVSLVEELLDELDASVASIDLAGFLRAERALWAENRDRLSALLDTHL